MSVDLTKLPQPLSPLKKFNWWFWVILLLVLVSTGCLIAFVINFFYLLSDLLLVLGAVIVPIGLWVFSLLYGIYFRGYREEYIKQWNIYREQRKQQLINYARRGFYVLNYQIITEYGMYDNAQGIISNQFSMISKKSRYSDIVIPHSLLPVPKDLLVDNFYERLYIIFVQWRAEYELLFFHLATSNIHVRLFIDTPILLDNIESLWLKTIGQLLTPTSFSLEKVQNSTKFLEKWLDNSEYDEDILLLINVHLFASPTKNEAEEALFMLLAGEQAFKKLADVIDTEQVAKIYRSEQTGELAKTLDHALLWGQEDKKTYDGVWYSGVSNQQNIDIMKHFNDIEFEPGGIFNIDTTIGNAKNSAYFFALALAVEYAQSTGNKQLIVVGEPDITASVVTTVAKK